MYNVGDKFEIEIAEIFYDDEVFRKSKLYRIKGFNSLVFDENGLNKLKKIEAKPNTVKASELTADTKVFCWNGDDENKNIRYFALLHKGHLYAYFNTVTSKDDGRLCEWKYMTLEDGTVVLPE